jgi:hypothetical protein
LHKHRRRRVRKKYGGVIAFDRAVIADLQEYLRDQVVATGWCKVLAVRRVARLLNKAGHCVRAAHA